ncbi:MAG: OmpA family protein [Azoarcus sp.]|jgi:OOP family OmpA-OmpF porin|nr:OmpA family protein [Azoarcus sp.]
MTKQNQMFVLAAIVSVGLSASAAFAQSADIVVDGKGDIPYVIDSRNVVARSGTGLCWRTSSWTPAAASTVLAGQFPVGCACDSDIVPKEKCQPPAPAVAPSSASSSPRVISEEEGKVKLAADTLFEFNKAVLKPEGRASLDNLVAQARQIKLEIILAVGHTDRLGSVQYNQILSDRRATAVRDYLVSQGIDTTLIYIEGKGKSQPVTGTRCDGIKNRKALIECLQPDRRVEIELIGTR